MSNAERSPGTARDADRPGVAVLPPLLVAVALVMVIVLHRLVPLPIGARLPVAVLGAVLAALGITSAVWGRNVMVEAGTNVSPQKPATAIVSAGPFRHTRNPLYLGVLALFVGISLMIGTWWGPILLVPVFLVLHFGVVLREERYLEHKFGASYLEYKRSVRRWL